MATHDEIARVDEVADDAAGADGGCTVDWGWLAGQEIESVTSDLQHWRVRFKSGLTLTVQAGMFQGKAFLMFDPWKAPA
jgi:hypothetical protein